MMFQSTNFDVLYNTYVHDRFLPYLVPIVVIAVLCAATRCQDAALVAVSTCDARRSRVRGRCDSMVRPGGEFEPIDADTPIAGVYRPLAHAFGSLTGARVALSSSRWSGARSSSWPVACDLGSGSPLALAAMLVVALVATTTYVFTRFFGTNDWATRPITNPQVGQFTWVDEAVHRNARCHDCHLSALQRLVPQLPDLARLPVLERIDRPRRRAAAWCVHLQQLLVPEGGLALQPQDRSRRRIADPVRARGRSGVALQGLRQGDRESARAEPDRRGATVADRLALLRALRRRVDSSGRDHSCARFREAGSAWPRSAHDHLRDSRVRKASHRGPVELSSNQGGMHALVSQDTAFHPIQVCVPAHGYADVRLRASESSAIPGDQATPRELAAPAQGRCVPHGDRACRRARRRLQSAGRTVALCVRRRRRPSSALRDRLRAWRAARGESPERGPG